MLSVAEHAPLVTVTVYVVVLPGVATGFDTLGLDNPAVGLQEYCVPPLAFNVVFCPEHNETSMPAFAEVLPTVTKTESTSLQPPVVTVKT
jgi:hypothetical protein